MISPPPSRIYLLRHGKSAPPRPDAKDFDRTLDDQGYAETELVSERAADKGYRPDVVISSTAMRCRQTTDAIRRAMGETIEPIFIDELYSGSLDTYLAIIAAQGDVASLMMVGHNPVMEQLLAALVGQESATQSLPSGFPTAGLAVLDHGAGDGDAENGWTLADFVRP